MPSVIMNEEKPRDYLCTSRRSMDGTAIAQSDREEIVDWMYTVAARHRIDFEMVAGTMGIVDRFLSKPCGVAQEVLRDRKQFVLIAIAALSICMESGEKAIPKNGFLANISRETSSEIKEMESSIQQGLPSGVHAPTSIEIARHFLSEALPGIDIETSRWSYLLDDVRFQTEYAVRDYYFTTHWPSTVAMAAILNSIDELLGNDRELMLRVFPSIVSKHFPVLTDVLAAKDRLWVEMERGHTTVVSDKIVENVEK